MPSSIPNVVFMQIKKFLNELQSAKEYVSRFDRRTFEDLSAEETIEFRGFCEDLYRKSARYQLTFLQQRMQVIVGFHKEIENLMIFKSRFLSIDQYKHEFLRPRNIRNAKEAASYQHIVQKLQGNLSGLIESMDRIITKLKQVTESEDLGTVARVKTDEFNSYIAQCVEDYKAVKPVITKFVSALSNVIDTYVGIVKHAHRVLRCKRNMVLEVCSASDSAIAMNYLREILTENFVRNLGPNVDCEHARCEKIEYMYSVHKLKIIAKNIQTQCTAFEMINKFPGIESLNKFDRHLKMYKQCLNF